MPEIFKSYYSIIPANVRYDKELKDKAKLLYGEITALCNEKGYCWATNNYFADLYGVSKETISRLVSNLADKGYVKVEIIYNGKQIIERRIYISPEVIAQKSIPIDEIVNTPNDKKRNTPIDENVKENNTKTFNTKSLNQSINQDESAVTSDDLIDEMDYEKVIAKNIDYEELKKTCPKVVDDIYYLMVDILYSSKTNHTINSENISASRVKKRLLDLRSKHICYVIDCYEEAGAITNVRAYLLTSLYNAPTTINSYYSNQSNQILREIRNGIS